MIVKKLERLAAFFSRYLTPLVLLSIILTVAFFIAINYGISGNLSGRAATSLGKLLGKASDVATIIAFAYYLLREAYVQIKKRKIMNLPLAGPLINITRLIHPFIGWLAVLLAALHGYILLFVAPAREGLEIWAGIAAMLLLVVVGISGWVMVRRPPTGLLRKSHRYGSFIFVAIYLLHKAIV
jgi:hypothetical protein